MALVWTCLAVDAVLGHLRPAANRGSSWQPRRWFGGRSCTWNLWEHILTVLTPILCTFKDAQVATLTIYELYDLRMFHTHKFDVKVMAWNSMWLQSGEEVCILRWLQQGLVECSLHQCLAEFGVEHCWNQWEQRSSCRFWPVAVPIPGLSKGCFRSSALSSLGVGRCSLSHGSCCRSDICLVTLFGQWSPWHGATHA